MFGRNTFLAGNIKCFEKGNTMNEFRYNFQEPDVCFDYYRKYTNLLIEELQPKNNKFNLKSIKQLNFNYLWDDSVNAGSREFKELDMISVNEGTIYKLYGLFYKLNTKKDIIELTHKTKSRTPINTKIFYENDKIDDKPMEIEIVFSDDKNSNSIAEYMAMFAIKWIIAHEVGHAFNGHTAYYSEVRKKIQSEKNEEEIAKLFLDLQSMEMDADAFAVNRIIDVAMDLYKKDDKIFKLLKNKQDILKLIICSVHAIFFIFRNCDVYDCMKTEHPPTFIRECLVLGAMKQGLLKKYNVIVDDDYMMNDIGKIENLICDIEGKKNEDYINYINNFHQEIKKYMTRIQSNFKNNIIYKINDESRLPIEGIDYL